MMEIQTIDDLKLISKKRPDKVTLRFSALDDAQNHDWSKQFNDLLDECGCSSGRQFITYAAPFYIILIVFLAAFTNLTKPVIIGIFVGAIVVTGIAGKIVGLRQRNQKIDALINQFLKDTNL
jgi:hypothetical protein